MVVYLGVYVIGILCIYFEVNIVIVKICDLRKWSVIVGIVKEVVIICVYVDDVGIGRVKMDMKVVDVVDLSDGVEIIGSVI